MSVLKRTFLSSRQEGSFEHLQLMWQFHTSKLTVIIFMVVFHTNLNNFQSCKDISWVEPVLSRGLLASYNETAQYRTTSET